MFLLEPTCRSNCADLTGASYGDGQTNQTQSWTYDAAGNRLTSNGTSGYSYDNLNRMTASPTTSYVSDILGNRTSETTGSVTTAYTWDALNRMTARSNSSTSANYVYCGDGMRTQKSVTTGSATTTDMYRRDDQMPFEDGQISGSNVTALRSVLGARVFDADSVTKPSLIRNRQRS